MMTPDQVLYSGVLRRIVSRGKKDMVAAPIVKAPYGGGGEAEFAKAHTDLTGENFGVDCHKWMEWQQQHSEIKPFDDVDVFKAGVLGGIELKVLPIATVSRDARKKRHPNTKVLSLDTGCDRLYQRGAANGECFTNPNLMFPTVADDKRFNQKDYVFALRVGNAKKACPLKAFVGGKVIND